MSILLKLNLENATRRSSALATETPEGRDSIISLVFGEKRRRVKRTQTEPNTPKSYGTSTTEDLDINKKDLEKPEKDKFLGIFEKPEKDPADGRAIHRKLAKSTFFEEHKELFEEKLDPEGIICLCKGLSLETFNENEIIYERGDKVNDKIYFVYKGEVEVLQLGEVATFKQSNFSTMSKEVVEGSPQPKPRMSLVFRQLNLESQITHDPNTGRRTLNLKGFMAANPHLKTFTGRKIGNGEYFGGEMLTREQLEREETVMAKMETHLLVMNVKDFEHVKNRYDKETIQRLNYLTKYLDVVIQNQPGVKNKLFSCMTDKVLPLGEILINEGDMDHHFYFLYEGKCEVQKKMREMPADGSSPKPAAHKFVPICLVENGTFLGEEVLFNPLAGYDYTIKVTSAKAVFFKFETKKFKHSLDKEIIQDIKERYEGKSKKHQEIYENVSKQINKRSSKIFSQPILNSKTPTPQPHINLGFGPKWDVVAGSYGSATHEPESISTVTQRNDGVSTKRFSAQLTLGDKSPKGEKRGSLNNKGIAVIRDQIKSFHHQQVVIPKPDRIITEEGSGARNRRSTRGFNTEHDEWGSGHKLDSLEDVSRVHGKEGRNNIHSNKMDDYLNSIGDMDTSPKGSSKKAHSKFFSDIEHFRIVESPFHHKEVIKEVHTERDIFIMKSGKIKSNDNGQSRSPLRKMSKSVKMPSPKINLEALRNQFFDSPSVSMRDYLAMYKKANLQNKLSRNIADTIQARDGEYAKLKKTARVLPQLHLHGDYSPKIYMHTEGDYVKLSGSKSAKGLIGKITPGRKNEHVVLGPIFEKYKQGKLVAKPRDLREK